MKNLFKQPLFIFIIYFLLCSFAHAQNNLRYNIEGIKGDILENVQTQLLIEQESYGNKISDFEIPKIAQHAKKEIQKIMNLYGYFRSTIRTQLIHKDSIWVLSYFIIPGPALKITHTDIKLLGEGSDNKKLKELIKNFPLRRDVVFQTKVYENAKDELFITAVDQGYVKATMEENKILINLKKYQATVIIHFQTGPRYYFGPITFTSNPYDPAFLSRFISLNENIPFSSQKLLALQQEMQSSFYFQEVQFIPDFNHIQNYRIPILVSVTPPKLLKYSLGIGYGTFTGARITAALSRRRIGDSGQHFDAQLKLSQILSGLAGKYYIPGRHPLTDQWIIGANYQKFKPKNGISNSVNLSGGFVKKLHHWQTIYNLSYLIDSYKVKHKPKQFSKLFYPSFNMAYVKTDSPINPLFGQSFYFTLQGSSQHLLSTTDFIQTDLKLKYLFSPTSFSQILLRGEFGYTVTHNIKELPLTMRFFTGGLNSVRGYPDSSIGPGRYLKVASIEYQNHIYGNWNAALFYDMGVASNHFNTRMNKGAGFGIIYKSMIGPVKVYIGQALSKHKKPHDIQFSIGPEF